MRYIARIGADKVVKLSRTSPPIIVKSTLKMNMEM